MSNWVEGRVVSKHCWTDRLFSLEIDAAIDDFKAGQYVKVGLDVDGTRVGRPYSCVNAPHKRPIEIYFNEVSEGPLTPRLSTLDPGDQVWVSSRASGIFTLDNIPDARYLWLFATGTALGVYLSMLATEEPWGRFERIVLIHGARISAELAYRERIAGICEKRPTDFSYLPVLSREAFPDALPGRIPALLASGEIEQRAGTRLEAETSHVMLCGNSHMIGDMKVLLEARGLKRHRRHEPGHYTTEQYH